ncbi:hypothetical protein M405DRAFT_493001 [Rhizopogon salebrosus TDB-379]|nr:hypothetical protein M405DRAFT_493001 [Rhizopogon salebrosus TDB-379]
MPARGWWCLHANLFPKPCCPLVVYSPTRLLNALIHHCNGSERFPLSRVSCRSFLYSFASRGLRQGSRLSSSHLTQLSSRLASLQLEASFHSEVLSFASIFLTAGDMAMSAGPGRAFVI